MDLFVQPAVVLCKNNTRHSFNWSRIFVYVCWTRSCFVDNNYSEFNEWTWIPAYLNVWATLFSCIIIIQILFVVLLYRILFKYFRVSTALFLHSSVSTNTTILGH